jgi:hypothetical protein
MRYKRPRCRADQQRDEIAAFQTIELHLLPAAPASDAVAAYRIDEDRVSDSRQGGILLLRMTRCGTSR